MVVIWIHVSLLCIYLHHKWFVQCHSFLFLFVFCNILWATWRIFLSSCWIYGNIPVGRQKSMDISESTVHILIWLEVSWTVCFIILFFNIVYSWSFVIEHVHNPQSLMLWHHILNLRARQSIEFPTGRYDIIWTGRYI